MSTYQARKISCGSTVSCLQPRRWSCTSSKFYASNVDNAICIKIEGELSNDNCTGCEEGKMLENTYESFKSSFTPDEMRCIALIAHNNMKPAMKDFVLRRQELLKKFRLTGTNTTMSMIRSVFGDNKDVAYGPTFTSGPLGGDAEVCALMCKEDIGCVMFFMDPLDPHPHQCDIDTVVRLANVHNILMTTNPTSAYALCNILEHALQEGKKDIIPSFFRTLETPGLVNYKKRQTKELTTLKDHETVDNEAVDR